jgi:hypothetical protein
MHVGSANCRSPCRAVFRDRLETLETTKQQGERPTNGAAISMVRSQCVRARGSLTQQAQHASTWMTARMRAITAGLRIRARSKEGRRTCEEHHNEATVYYNICLRHQSNWSLH